MNIRFKTRTQVKPPLKKFSNKEQYVDTSSDKLRTLLNRLQKEADTNRAAFNQTGDTYYQGVSAGLNVAIKYIQRNLDNQKRP